MCAIRTTPAPQPSSRRRHSRRRPHRNLQHRSKNQNKSTTPRVQRKLPTSLANRRCRRSHQCDACKNCPIKFNTFDAITNPIPKHSPNRKSESALAIIASSRPEPTQSTQQSPKLPTHQKRKKSYKYGKEFQRKSRAGEAGGAAAAVLPPRCRRRPIAASSSRAGEPDQRSGASFRFVSPYGRERLYLILLDYLLRARIALR